MKEIKFYMQDGSFFGTRVTDDIIENLGRVISNAKSCGGLLRISSGSSKDTWLNIDKIIMIEVMDDKAQGVRG